MPSSKTTLPKGLFMTSYSPSLGLRPTSVSEPFPDPLLMIQRSTWPLLRLPWGLNELPQIISLLEILFWKVEALRHFKTPLTQTPPQDAQGPRTKTPPKPPPSPGPSSPIPPFEILLRRPNALAQDAPRRPPPPHAKAALAQDAPRRPNSHLPTQTGPQSPRTHSSGTRPGLPN